MKLYLSKQKKELFIKTSLWNSVIEIIKKEKTLDITSYIVSVQIKGELILLKTNNPIINSELYIYDDKIKDSFFKKINNLDLDNYKFEIKYI